MGSGEVVRGLVVDPDGVELPAADRAMIDYALKLTRAPHRMRGEDADDLRSAGFADAAILDVCQVVAYYNYVNRLADGLGVELEDFWQEAELIVTREELEGLMRAREGEPAP